MEGSTAYLCRATKLADYKIRISIMFSFWFHRFKSHCIFFHFFNRLERLGIQLGMFSQSNLFEWEASFKIHIVVSGAKLWFLMQGCQTLTLRPKADLKPHFWVDFSHFFLNQRLPKRMFSNRRVPWHPWHPC